MQHGDLADELYDRWISGLDDDYVDEAEAEHQYAHRKAPECRNCSSRAVYWYQEYGTGRWVLLDSETEKPHVCDPAMKHRFTASAFDSLD